MAFTTRTALKNLVDACDAVLNGNVGDIVDNLVNLREALRKADDALDALPDADMDVISDADTGEFIAAFADEDLARWFVDESGQVAVNVRTVEVEP